MEQWQPKKAEHSQSRKKRQLRKKKAARLRRQKQGKMGKTQLVWSETKRNGEQHSKSQILR